MQWNIRMSMTLVLKIIVIPTLHFAISVVLVGAGLLTLIRRKTAGTDLPFPANALLAVSLGILYNAAQFALLLLVYRKFPVGRQAMLAIGKYAVDLFFLALVARARPRRFLELLKQFVPLRTRRSDAVLLVVAALLGLLAILNFPHVHDSGQLMATNSMLVRGADFLAAKRYGLGFSAMIYFPAAVFPGLPLGTMASGFKLWLLLLTGLAAIFGSGKLRTLNDSFSKFLYFSIIISSYLGLYGMMQLGKDSAWAVLFSLVFMFSLFDRRREQGYGEPVLHLLCAMALGMIAIPYLAIFCSLWLALNLLPGRFNGWRGLLPAAVIIMVVFGSLLLPVKMAIANLAREKTTQGNYSYWDLVDGKTDFYEYFFAFKRLGHGNSAPLVFAGMLGILLLPLARKRFADPAIRSAAFFLPVATLGCMFLVFLARDFLPANRQAVIPFTPFTSFDAWNLMKDLPQYYVQIISGIFFIILLDALVCRLTSRPQLRQRLYCGACLLAAALILSANSSRLLALRQPAHFYSYGGNKNRHYARLMDHLQRHPEVKRILMTSGMTQLNPHVILWDIHSYFPRTMVRILGKGTGINTAALWGKTPFVLVVGKDGLAGCREKLTRLPAQQVQTVELFSAGSGGIFFIDDPK
jgi:hypothetical protein